MWQGWINGIIGLWLIVSGIIGAGLHAPWNYIIAGVLMAILGFWTAKFWQSVITGILGIWMIISGILSATLMHPANMIIVGIITAVLSFWESIARKPQTKMA
ncbi:MAG: hypothetical protein D6813_06945 [Calditrichaeota bacterium]|nr:MAG: hypothetical protein D6813_06945 [Calditrichota bacterium]